MPLEERLLRHQILLQRLHQEDLHAWQQRFLDHLYLDDLYDRKKCPVDGGFLGINNKYSIVSQHL